MTCVVSMIKNGDIYMAADSCGSAGGFTVVRSDPKIFIKGPMIFGFAGSFRQGHLLHYKLKIPKHPKKMSDVEYLNSKFIDAVRVLLINNGSAMAHANQESLAGTFLLGYRSNVYQIDYDLQVGIHSRDYDSIGSGSELALGSLFSTENMANKPKARIFMALSAAAEFNAGVLPPFKLLVLKGRK